MAALKLRVGVHVAASQTGLEAARLPPSPAQSPCNRSFLGEPIPPRAAEPCPSRPSGTSQVSAAAALPGLRRSRPARWSWPGAPAGVGPAAGLRARARALLPSAAAERCRQRPERSPGARHPGVGQGEPAVPSWPPCPPCPLASTWPSCAPPGLPPGCGGEVSGLRSGFLLLPPPLVTGVNTGCLAEARGRRLQECVASEGLGMSPAGRDTLKLCPLRRGPFRHSSENRLRPLPHCVLKLSYYSLSARLGRCCGVQGTEGEQWWGLFLLGKSRLVEPPTAPYLLGLFKL